MLFSTVYFAIPTENDAKLTELNIELERLRNETNQNLIESQAAQLAYKVALAKNIADFPDSNNGLEDILKNAADIAVAAAQAAAHVGETFIDAGLNAIGLTGGLLGGAGNFFGGIIKTFINIAIIGAVVFGIYLLFSSGIIGKITSSVKPKQTTKYEPLPERQSEISSRLDRFDSITKKMMRNSRRMNFDDE